MGVKPDSVTISYTAGSVARTMVDNSAGVFTHSGTANLAATASLNYVTGELVIHFASIAGGYRPSTSSIVTVAYEQELAAPGEQLVTSETIAVTTPSAFNCGRTGISPKSFRIVRPMEAVFGYVTLVDDGAGGLVTLFSHQGDLTVSAGQSAGTINYTTGDVTLETIYAGGWRYEPNIPASLGVPQPGQWAATSVPLPPLVADYTVSSKSAAISYAAKTDEITISDVGFRYDTTTTIGESIVPGSVWLFFQGSGSTLWNANNSFVDRADGLLYSSMSNITTGAATVAGEIDYSTGIATIRQMSDAVTLQDSPPLRACVTARGNFTVVTADFRTPGSPLRPASFYVQATDVDGVQCTGTADANGLVTGVHVRGSINGQTGVAHVEFGDLVGPDWIPREIFPSTVRFSGVVLSNLPLDPSILGLDPVRLPSDGRVPVVRSGDVAVIHHTGTVTLPNPAVAGAALSAGRENVAVVELRDATGQLVPADRYSFDLAAGTGVLAAPLVLTGFVQPLVLRHRIEEMAQVADAQISGAVSISAPLLRNYPAGSYLSTALLAGDMAARVENVFDQATWTNVWSATLIGSPATAELNTLQYPIEVSNAGAIKERWRAQVVSLSPLTIAIYGENLGFLGNFPAAGTIAPVNALTGEIYWAIQPGAWGVGNGGWAVGNNVRWDTVSAAYPISVLRVILPGAALTGDAVRIESRGDVD